MTQERMIDKIKALMNKTSENGATDAEAQSAIDMAYRLMQKYQLTEDDLAHEPADDYHKVDEAKHDRCRSFVGGVFFFWEGSLATFVSQFVGVEAYMDNRKNLVRKNGFVQFDQNDQPRYGKSIVFYGIAEDAVMAAELYDELRMLIASMAVAKYGTVFKGEGGAYAQGFVSGLFSKLGSAKADERRLAVDNTSLTLIARREDLIKYKSNKAKDWLEKTMGMKIRGKSYFNGVGGHGSATAEGWRDGKETNVEGARRRKIQA